MASKEETWPLSKVVLVSAGVGVIAFLIFMLLLKFAFWGSFLWALIVGIIIFLILWLNFTEPGDGGQGAQPASGGGSGGGAATGSSASTGGAAGATATSAAPAADTVTATGDAAVSDAGVDTPADAADAADAADDDTAAAPEAASAMAASASSIVKPSTALPGQAELAARKGTWKYEGAAGAATGSSASSAATDIPDYDKDGVQEGTDEGSKPEMLSAARAGGADNLKEIKGVGPKMEKMLNEMGVYHFDQVAGWTADEVAWVDANLQGFKGRVSRDDWVGQARILMTGAETEFSQRVADGKVY